MEEGFAITVVPEDELNPVEGDQLKLLAPVAVRVTDSLEQMEGEDGETETAGGEFTFTVASAELELRQPPVLPVTVYV